MLQRLVVLAVFVLGCGVGGSGSSIEVSSQVSGPFVEVVAHRVQPGDVVTVGAQSQTAEPARGALRFEVPADRFANGARVDVTLTRAGKTDRTRVGATLAPHDLEPQLSLGDCTPGAAVGPEIDDVGDRRDVTAMWIKTKAWHHAYGSDRKELCTLRADGKARLLVGTHGDATVTIAGHPVALVDGRGEYVLDPGALARKLVLAEIADDGRSNSELFMTLEATVTRAGASRTEIVGVLLTYEDIHVALHKAFAAWDPRAPWPWPRTPHTGPARGAALVTRNVEVEVDGAPRRAMNGWYAFPRIAGATARVDELDLIAIATPVDVEHAGRCAYTTVSGPGPVRNVAYKAGLEVVAYDATGAEVARRTFAHPRGVVCPDALASRDDRTTLVVSTPPPDAIDAWLESLRAK